MEVGVIGDIHGNLVALEAVISKLKSKSVDKIVCTGDIIGIAGWPDECVELVQKECDSVVLGNHDTYVVPEYHYVPNSPSEKQEYEFLTKELTAESIEWLSDLPEKITINDNNYTVVIAHANPWKDPKTGFPGTNYVDKKDWVSFSSQYMNGELVIIGHTHDQGGQNMNKFKGQSGTILNPGSVGMNWDTDARYATVNFETHEFELHRTYYPGSKVEERLQEIGIEKNPGKGQTKIY